MSVQCQTCSRCVVKLKGIKTRVMEKSEDVRRINGVEVYFPYKPYPSQISMMAKIIAGLKNKQNCLLESPTGSGKSLALLCSALAWQGAQQDLARKEEDQRNESINGCCVCNQAPDVSPDIKPLPTDHVAQTSIGTPRPGTTVPTPVSTLQTPQQVPSSMASSMPQHVKMVSMLSTPKQGSPSQSGADDDDDFKESTKKFRTPGSVQTRTPIRVQYETPSDMSKTIIVKHLSRGSDGQMQEQQTVLVIPQGKQVSITPGVDPTQLPHLAPYVIQMPQGVCSGSGQTAPTLDVTRSCTGGIPGNPQTPATSTGKNSCTCSCRSKSYKPAATKRKIPKIYFGTRTHKQIAQIIRELRKTFYKDIKMTILASREHTCIHPGVSKSSSKKDGCRDLLDGPGCLFNSNVRKISSQNILKNFYGKDVAWDIEDLVNLCSEKRVKACPYYVSRGLRGDADIVFCPYNYLVDPMIRKSMEINLKDEIVILDEAHNIEDSAREAVSKSVEHDQIVKMIKELEDLVKKQVKEYEHHMLLQMCSRLDVYIRNSGASLEQRNFDQASKVWAGMDIVARLDSVGLGPKDYPELKRVFDAVCEEEENDRRRDGLPPPRLTMGSINVLDALFTMLDFLYRENLKFVDDYRVAIIRSMSYSTALDTSGQWLTSRNRGGRREIRQVYTLNFWCLNPAVAFSDFSVVHNVVLTSGTLSPMSSFSSELGMPFPIAMEANHVIKDSQVWVGSMGEGPSGGKLQATFRNTETWAFQDELGKLVLNVCKAIPHGVLCFFPSYKMLSKLSERWQGTGVWGEMIKKKKIVSEPRGGDKVDFDELLRYFYSVIEGNAENSNEEMEDCCRGQAEGEGVDGALFLAVCRGKVSEGLDFADNNARAVITVGIPFPNIKDIQVELKRKYNDQYTKERGLLSGSEWYEIQAYRALNQALGRCIRHRNDWGALIIVDDRFVRQPQKYLKGLSKWVRNKAQTYGTFRQAMSSLTNFTQNMIKQCTDTNSLDKTIPQFTPNTYDTPAKLNGYPLTGQLRNGDLTQLAELAQLSPVKPEGAVAMPTNSIAPVNQPTSTPINHISPPMSLPDKADPYPTPKELKFDSPLPNNRVSLVLKTKEDQKPAATVMIAKDKLMKFQFQKSDSPRTSNENQTSDNHGNISKDPGVNKFYKFYNISDNSLSDEKEGPSLASVVRRNPDCSDVKSDKTINDEDFLMSTPNLFDSDMSDPETSEVNGEPENPDQSKESKPSAKRPLFRRAVAKASEMLKSWTGVDQSERNDDSGSGEENGKRQRYQKKMSSESEYDINTKPEDREELDESLNTKRNTRGRKRKVLGKTKTASKRTKGVDFLDDVDSSNKKGGLVATVEDSSELCCSKCGAPLISSIQGMERGKRLPSFLRNVWRQRNCETIAVSRGRPTDHLTLFTNTVPGSDRVQLDSHWDMDDQCCVQFLYCASCPTSEQFTITAARVVMTTQTSLFAAGQMWFLASCVT